MFCVTFLHREIFHGEQIYVIKNLKTMKAKVLLLFGLGVLGFCHYTALASTEKGIPYSYEECMLPEGAEKIELHGDLDYNVGPNAIEAGITADAVYIGFNQSFGNVSISIYNGMGGLVYSTVVNTDVQSTIIIPFASVASGTYTVELNNANGYADGEFNKD